MIVRLAGLVLMLAGSGAIASWPVRPGVRVPARRRRFSRKLTPRWKLDRRSARPALLLACATAIILVGASLLMGAGS